MRILSLLAILPMVMGLMVPVAEAGNGAPNGAHYNLNIIGVQNPKTADMTDGSGHVIFVPLSGSAKIMLSEGAFQVLDANGTDGSAKFQLPNPDPTNSGTTTYSVYARALGKPNGSAKMTTCATGAGLDGVYGTADDEQICSVGSVTVTRKNGKSTFTNVSKDLLYIYADINGDGITERVNLFNDSLQDYFWQYDNSGLKLLQLRFYPVPTTVPAA
ncbi:MAG: hypothetical protein ACM3NH_05040 [Candidatus Saccharibacteria bacterium]